MSADIPTLDLRVLFGAQATDADKQMRAALAEIDESGNGNFKIDTTTEFQKVRDAFETSQPDLFARFLEIASRPSDPQPRHKITTTAEARAEVQVFLRSSFATRLTNMKKNSIGNVVDLGDTFAVRVPNYFGLGKHELIVDKAKGKVTEAHDMNFWGERMGGYNSVYKVDERY